MSNPYTNMPYDLYLTTTHWERTRRRKIGAAMEQCEQCGRRDGLEVHHLTYERIGEELPEDLQVLCPICHREAHGIEPTVRDWTRARFMYGSETIKAHQQMLRQRRESA